MEIPIRRVIEMRNETISRKEDSNLKLPRNKAQKKMYSRAEMDEMILRLAEIHGII